MDTKQKLDKLLTYFGTNKNQLGTATGKRQTFYDIGKGQIKSFSPELVSAIKNIYPEINENWFLFDEGEMIKTKGLFSKPPPPTDKKADALEQLKKVTNKPNGKQKNANEGTILTDDHLVPVKTYIIPIKGFAGLRKHFFADDYIHQQFEETLTYVHKSERVPELLKIQADGNSMPPLISPGDHVLCEPINDITLDYKFKAEKIYCFFHHLRGILFKRAKNMPFDKIELSSDNEDKIEYPNEIFDIGEFKKILIVRTIEKKV